MKYLMMTFFLSPMAFAYMSHYQIVDKFLALPQNDSKTKAFMQTAPLEKVISEESRREQDLYRTEEFIHSPFPEFRDYRYRDTPIKKQIGPKCSAYGLVATMENLMNDPEEARISERHLWSYYGQYSSEAAVRAALKNPITEYQYWEHDKSSPKKDYKEHMHTQLTHVIDLGNNVREALRSLHDGNPVYLGTSVTSSMGRCDDVLHPRSKATGGGHAIAIVGYGFDDRLAGGGYFVIKNSWGTQCGDEGYQYLPFDHCSRQGQYCIMWAVTGIQNEFVGDIWPVDEAFNPKKVFIKINTTRRWYQFKKHHNIYLAGDSVHLKQIESATFKLRGTKGQKTFHDFSQTQSWKIKTNRKYTVDVEIITKTGESFTYSQNL